MKSKVITLDMVSKVALQAAASATLIVTVLFATFMVAEPRISHGQSDTATFRVRQTITDETSFLVDPVNVIMSGGGITGITGGNASGSSRFVVRSNNATGYYVNIAFFDNAGPYAMLGDIDGGTQIRDYGGDVGGEPSYNWTASTASQFAYSVQSSTTADTDTSFRHNGTNCNQTGSYTYGKCWKSPSTSNFRIVSRTSAASNGATSTIYFKVNVPSGSNPTPTAQTYTATATLSLFTQ